MTTVFAAIFEEFEQELDAIRLLIIPNDGGTISSKARVAGANAAVLLVAATFEEYIRELAREYAKAVVAGTASYDKLPSKLAATAWKRTIERLARMQFNPKKEGSLKETNFLDTQTKFLITFDFCRGDLKQDIYQDLIHNENNMRPQELNSMFKISGLGNICFLACEAEEIKAFFGVNETEFTHGKLLEALEEFFSRRNQTAHSIRAMQSASPDSITKDIDLLQLFGKSLVGVLESNAPNPVHGIE